MSLVKLLHLCDITSGCACLYGDCLSNHWVTSVNVSRSWDIELKFLAGSSTCPLTCRALLCLSPLHLPARERRRVSTSCIPHECIWNVMIGSWAHEIVPVRVFSTLHTSLGHCTGPMARRYVVLHPQEFPAALLKVGMDTFSLLSPCVSTWGSVTP